MTLRCFPGCLAIILRDALKGRTIECDKPVFHPTDGAPSWTYKGERMFAYVDGTLKECYTIADDNLRPIVPPASNRERVREILVGQGFMNPDDMIAT